MAGASSALWPRDAGKFISSKAREVKVRGEGVSRAARVIVDAVKAGELTLEEIRQDGDLPLGLGLSDGQLVNWVFLIDSLNFCFWMPDGQPKFTVTHEGKTRSGYLAMVAAVNRALAEGRDMCNPAYYSSLSLQDLQYIFRSDTPSPMPLLEKRLDILKEVGGILKEKFEGTFECVLRKAENRVVKLVEIVTENFPCFRDTVTFEGETVAFYKRAQILAADIWILYQGQTPGAFTDIGELTMFADYRVPQVLAYLGALEYSEHLYGKLKEQHLFSTGDREEAEIRGCSIEATERIVSEAKKLLIAEGGNGTPLNSVMVDYHLWIYRMKHSAELDCVPYHRVSFDIEMVVCISSFKPPLIVTPC